MLSGVGLVQPLSISLPGKPTLALTEYSAWARALSPALVGDLISNPGPGPICSGEYLVDFRLGDFDAELLSDLVEELVRNVESGTRMILTKFSVQEDASRDLRIFLELQWRVGVPVSIELTAESVAIAILTTTS